MVVVVFALFVLVVLLGAAAVCKEMVADEFIRWEQTWNHPEDRPFPGEPGTHWGPRLPWLCNFADWITGGRCHD